MKEVKTKNEGQLFVDPEFQILHYWNDCESIFVGFRKSEQSKFGTLSEMIDSKVKPALQKLLGHNVRGYFDPIYSFDMDERFVLLNLNGEEEVAVCNI